MAWRTVTFTETEYGKDVWNDVKDYMRDMRERGHDASAIRSDTKDSEGRKVKAYVVRISEAPMPASPTASEALEGATQEAVRKVAARAGREIGEEEGEEEFGPTRFGERTRREEEMERAKQERARAEEQVETARGELRSADPVAGAVARAYEKRQAEAGKRKKKTATRGRVLYDSYGRAIVVEGLPKKRSATWKKGLKETGKLGKRKDTKALTSYKGLSRKFGTPRTKMSAMPGTPKIAQTGKGMPRIVELGLSRSPRIASDPDLSRMRDMSWPPRQQEGGPER